MLSKIAYARFSKELLLLQVGGQNFEADRNIPESVSA